MAHSYREVWKQQVTEGQMLYVFPFSGEQYLKSTAAQHSNVDTPLHDAVFRLTATHDIHIPVYLIHFMIMLIILRTHSKVMRGYSTSCPPKGLENMDYAHMCWQCIISPT